MLPVLFGPIYFQALRAAVQFNLFTKLDENGPLSLNEIATSLKITQKPARVLVDVLLTLRLIRKAAPTGGGQPRYRNCWQTKLYFSERSSYNINAIVQWYHHIVYKPIFHFHKALQTGRNVGLDEISGSGETLYERLVYHPELEKIFQDAMEEISFLANRSLADFIDFSSVTKLVDVGGGNASNIITIAKRYPHLQAVVFDSASVGEIARQNIEKNGLGNRLSAVTGNCFADAYPDDADCYLYCHFMDIWSEAQNRSLIQKTYDALPTNGKIIVFDIMERDDGNGPLTAAAGHPYFLTLATGDGFIYSAREYGTWLKDAGFLRIKRVRLPQDHLAVIGEK